jgi:glyoxylase-like metal-dependent hydrolase (beta-lactamase superfamily II)
MTEDQLQVQQLLPGVRRIIAPNPGMMTGPGTNTYLLGERSVTVIDPGPYIPEHQSRIRRAARGPIQQILVTHTHRDHSPGALPLAAATGARLLGTLPPGAGRQDDGFKPDQLLADGDLVQLDGGTLEVVATPGHASNHLCYLHRELGCLFTGDHIMHGSTVVIAPPDGNMIQYLASLERLRGLPLKYLAPGHGDLMSEPVAVVDWLITHRLRREARVFAALSDTQAQTLDDLLPSVYSDVPAAVMPAARLSLLAHLEKLLADGRAAHSGDAWRSVNT